MALQSRLESCSLCLRDIAQQRHIKGNVCLKYSGSSTSEVVAYIVGQEVPIISICFRCYRLLLGIDYHQHEFKRLKDSIVKIYFERNPLEKPSSSTSEDESSDIQKPSVEGQLSTHSEVTPSDNSVQNAFNIECPSLQDVDVNSEATRKEEENDVREGEVISSEQKNIQEIPTEESNISVRSSRRSKKEKKLCDFEYYTDVSKDDNSKMLEPQMAEETPTETDALVNENNKKNHCNLCSKDFALRKDYLSHSCLKIIGKRVSFKCKGCQMPFSVRQHYMKHINNCYKNVPVKCHLCMTELQSAAYLPRHLEAFHKGAAVTQKGSLCDLCGRTFSRKEALQRHQAKVHRISYGTHQCAKCGQTFLHTSLLMEHIRAHRGYPCPECNKIFTCMSNLKVHKQTYHQNKTLYVCSPCNKRWRFHASYTNHMRKVHGEAQFKCPRCKMLFSAENAFERHKEVCAGFYKKPPVPNKNSQTSAPLKGKKNPLLVSGEVDSRTRLPIMAPKDSANNYNSNQGRNYLRLKKVVRKVTASAKHHIALPSKDVMCIGKRSSKVFKETEMLKNDRNHHNLYPALSAGKVLVPPALSESDHALSCGGSIKASTEIVVETVEDLSSDCQLVILVEDGSDEQK
ncbi:zinc finger protein 480-like [Macrobrachium rosenbergii]|uniref:zinc finger protein 480-like n=1 Tax=Macrobrachium rosenbergii TaxID=79674 RepID=UPI0034D7AF85